MGAQNVTVIDDPDKQRFTVDDAGVSAELNYETGDGRLVITRTFTAPEHRGQGIAGQLVAAAVERARSNNETVVPACWYARQWIDENPTAVEGVQVG
jgi:uncharacterized protein